MSIGKLRVPPFAPSPAPLGQKGAPVPAPDEPSARAVAANANHDGFELGAALKLNRGNRIRSNIPPKAR